jgi:hypothetical protein
LDATPQVSHEHHNPLQPPEAEGLGGENSPRIRLEHIRHREQGKAPAEHPVHGQLPCFTPLLRRSRVLAPQPPARLVRVRAAATVAGRAGVEGSSLLLLLGRRRDGCRGCEEGGAGRAWGRAVGAEEGAAGGRGGRPRERHCGAGWRGAGGGRDWMWGG